LKGEKKMSHNPELVIAAQRYAAQGLAVFPCRLRDEGDKKAKSPYSISIL